MIYKNSNFMIIENPKKNPRISKIKLLNQKKIEMRKMKEWKNLNKNSTLIMIYQKKFE